jgi:hypothetical protein
MGNGNGASQVDHQRHDNALDDRMRNLHEVLKAAALRSRPGEKTPMVTRSVKLPEGLEKMVDAICQRNGTTFSAFMRECAEQMVREYGAPEGLINQ